MAHYHPGHRTRDGSNTSSTFDREVPILKSPHKSKPTQEAGTEQQPSLLSLVRAGALPTHSLWWLLQLLMQNWGHQGKAAS